MVEHTRMLALSANNCELFHNIACCTAMKSFLKLSLSQRRPVRHRQSLGCHAHQPQCHDW